MAVELLMATEIPKKSLTPGALALSILTRPHWSAPPVFRSKM